jgi:glycerophosphoryl diester phosphodiesterase
MDFVEIDVRETLDGVFVSMHDDTVDRTTNGTGAIAQMTWAQIKALNAADYAPWTGTQYDPSPVPRLEEILQLARDTGKGIEFDIKDLRDPFRFLDLVASYGLMSRSFFNISGDNASAAQAYNPEIRVIYNLSGGETPDQLYTETRRSAVYGSRLERFSPEHIAAVHDGCSFALPHSYDLGVLAEADQFRQARARGADGAQVDQPDLIAEVAQRRVPAELLYRPESRQVCLRNRHNSLGIPRRLLSVFRGLQLPSVRTTDRSGCVTLPRERGSYWIVHFATPGVQEASLQVSAPGASLAISEAADRN